MNSAIPANTPPETDPFIRQLLRLLPSFLPRARKRLRGLPIDPGLAEDLVQGALARILNRRGSCTADSPAGIAAWIGTVFRNDCLNAVRQEMRQLRRGAALAEDHAAEGGRSAADEVVSDELLSQVVAAVAALAPSQQTAVAGRFPGSFAAEVSEQPSARSAEATRKRQGRAFASLRARLSAELPFPT